MTKTWLCLPALVGLVAVWIWSTRLDPQSQMAASSLPSNGLHADDEKKADGAKPKVAVADSAVYRFGVMDPYRRQRHTFIIRNEGDAPLTLEKGSTSCKCTLCQVLDPVVAPGGQGRVLVEWQTAAAMEEFHHGATILTNDPDRPGVYLHIKGAVRTHLAGEPDQIVFSSVAPDHSATGQCVIYSEQWDRFTLEDFQSPLDGLSWSVEPLEESELPSQRARAGYRLTVTIPSTLPQGSFSSYLQFEVVPTASQDPAQTYRVPVQGKVLRRLSVYGPSIDLTGTINIGAVASGVGFHRRLRMKVRDEQLDMKVTRIETVPEGLKVRVTPEPSAPSTGLYQLDIELPPDTPPCAYMANKPGKIHLAIEHPRISELDLAVHFAVLRNDIDQPRRAAP